MMDGQLIHIAYHELKPEDGKTSEKTKTSVLSKQIPRNERKEKNKGKK